MNAYRGERSLTAAAYFHARFESIHPFADGNGRVGRALLNYFLMIRDEPPLIIYDPEGTMGYSSMDMFNLDIAETSDGVTLTADWYLYTSGGQTADETEYGDDIFLGQWTGNSLWASGPGGITIERFYSLGGKQYAVGTFDSPDGTPAVIALARP